MAYNLLKGKRGIITGALDSNSIAWKVAEKAHEEGATFVLTNAPIAMRMGEINALAEKTNSKIVPADATSVEELTNLFTQSQEILGGKIDFVLHSIGMSVNIRKKIAYPELNYDYYAKGVKTTAGTGIKGFGDFFDYADAIAPLGNATAEDCANYCVTLFSDLTKMVTMQNLFHDGGYSTTGVSDLIMKKAGITEA